MFKFVLKNILVWILISLPASLFAATQTQSAIVTSHPLATAAGARVLGAGGSAADAAIAAAFTLAVVQPAHSGLGGGGMFVYFDKAQNEASFFDYTEELPSEGVSAFPGFFPDVPKQKTSAPVKDAGVPGFVAGMGKTHARFGKLDWTELFDEAVHHASAGFLVGDDVVKTLAMIPKERLNDKDFELFFAGPLRGKKPVLKQENLAGTLEKIRDGGAKEFYGGAPAQSPHPHRSPIRRSKNALPDF